MDEWFSFMVLALLAAILAEITENFYLSMLWHILQLLFAVAAVSVVLAEFPF